VGSLGPKELGDTLNLARGHPEAEILVACSFLKNLAGLRVKVPSGQRSYGEKVLPWFSAIMAAGGLVFLVQAGEGPGTLESAQNWPESGQEQRKLTGTIWKIDVTFSS
jgi:hypothetical protein